MASSLIGGSVVWDLTVDDKKFTGGLSKAKAQVDAFAHDIDGSFSGIANTIHSTFKKAEGASLAFAAGLGAIALAGAGALGFGVKMAADIETARQGFTTLLGSVDKANDAIAMIKKDAAATPFEFANLVRANQMLTSVTKNAPQSERLLLNVGRALSAAGKSSTELDNVIVNLQQIANTAHISELDIRQFGFAGINILELLADHYGVTKAEAVDMVKNSKNAFADLEAAFAKAGEGGGKFSRAFIDQAGTFNQLMSNFRDILSQTAADIVTQSGVFDIVKGSIKNFTSALVEFKPQIVAGIKDFFTFVSNNGTIVAGIILGGLTPAFYGLAGAIAANLITLAPFMLAGVALVAIAQLIISAMGGWEQAQKKVKDVFDLLALAYNTYLKPALDSLWRTIQTELVPQLRELWANIAPVLIPTLKVLAAILAGVLVASLWVAINILKELIQWVAASIKRFNEFVDFLTSIPGTVRAAFSGVYDAIVTPFQNAYNRIRDIANNIRKAASEISPFTKHSPSLVEQVVKGIGIIKDQYASLNNMSFPKFTEMSGFSEPMLSTPAPAYADTPSTSVSKSVNINIGEMNVRDETDIDRIGRDLGFRIGINPSIFDK